MAVELKDGNYTVEVALEGGSGRATIESPAPLEVAHSRMTATIIWSSPYYDYMYLNGEYYYPVNEEGNSVFEIPVESLEHPLKVDAETLAMSSPHVISYTISFDAETLQSANQTKTHKTGMELYGVLLAGILMAGIFGILIRKHRKTIKNK